MKLLILYLLSQLKILTFLYNFYFLDFFFTIIYYKNYYIYLLEKFKKEKRPSSILDLNDSTAQSSI